jgi:hypothetical protein
MPVILATQGGRNQEDCGSKPTQVNGSPGPISKKTHHEKRAGGVAQGVGPEFKSQSCKTKISKAKWAGHIAQVVGHLPSKCEALSSKPQCHKKRKMDKEYNQADVRKGTQKTI